MHRAYARRSHRTEDDHLQSIAHGLISLEQLANQYGAERRRLRVSKMRGVAFRGGFHDFAIRRGGLDVFPRIVAAEHNVPAIALTAYARIEDRLKAIRAGFQLHLSKPVEPVELISMIQSLARRPK